MHQKKMKKMKNAPYLLLFICLLIFSCKETPKKEISENRTSALVPEPDLNLRLTGEKTSVDSTLIKSKNALKFIKIDDKQAPKMVKLGDEPDYQTAYFVYKDSTNTIKAITEVPTSKSGDWYAETTHYFDNSGQVYAFQKQLNTFYNSNCNSDDSHVSIRTIEYFQGGKSVAKISTKKDAKGVEVKDEKCSFQDLPMPVYATLMDWAKAVKLVSVVNK
jgi:hypothetical protein